MSCVEWGGAIGSHGYGMRRYCGRVVLVHRLVAANKLGLPLDGIRGKVVLHTCDNRKCVNPDHLVLGTQKDNIHDMILKGRAVNVANEKHGRCELSDAQVADIRRVHRKGSREFGAKALGKRYGVSHSHILSIVGFKLRPINKELNP